MLCFNKNINGITITLSLPKFKKNSYSFNQYEVTYRRPNGHIKTELRTDLPRVCEFNDYDSHSIKDYVGKTTGLNWEIKTIRIVNCKYI